MTPYDVALRYVYKHVCFNVYVIVMYIIVLSSILTMSCEEAASYLYYSIYYIIVIIITIIISHVYSHTISYIQIYIQS